MVTAKEIIQFWFDEISPRMHFAKDAEFDSLIRKRFLSTYENVVAGKTTSWRNLAEGRLAEIIVLDQFARNMFRDTPKAFAADELCLRLAQAAVHVGDDMKLDLGKRVFFYMPYMHSESLATHEEAVRLFSQEGLEENLKYELLHKRIIERFGRYPHRNAILSRESTQEEINFLKEKNSSF